jgi:AraC-like DNA-binding protein
MNRQFRISGLLPERLTGHGLALPDLLRLAGLPPGFFHRPKIYATTDELFSLWRAVGEMSPDPAIGLRLGAESRVERYEPAAIAAVCSRSFGDALQRIARYKQLTCPEEIRIHNLLRETSVEFFFHLQAREIQPDTLVDLALSWIYAIGRRGTNAKLRPLRLELARPARNPGLFERHFNCPVSFKARRNALVFRSDDLNLPFVTHNADLLSAIDPLLENELQARHAEPDVAGQVKRALKQSLAGKRPSLQSVARELGISPRTLQRRLTLATVTFQQLIEETRRELARHYLQQGSVELKEVSFLLGYEDANSFFRAFQSWEGTPPGEWRTRHGTADLVRTR